MYQVTQDQQVTRTRRSGATVQLAPVIAAGPTGELDQLLTRLGTDSNWGERQKAARKLGDMGDPAALSGILNALPADPFWMVRVAMMQALEKIGDPRAIPTLQRVAEEDAFLTARCQATKSIETLSRKAG